LNNYFELCFSKNKVFNLGVFSLKTFEFYINWRVFSHQKTILYILPPLELIIQVQNFRMVVVTEFFVMVVVMRQNDGGNGRTAPQGRFFKFKSTVHCKLSATTAPAPH